MIANQLVLALILAGATASAALLGCLLFGPRLTRLWRRATPLGRFAFVSAALGATLFAGTKTNGTDEVEGPGDGGQESSGFLLCPPPPLLSTPSARPPVTPADLAYGWQPLGPCTNASVDYTMPANAMLASNWWVRGAFEDVTAVSNLWAYSWGKLRFALDDTNEITAVGAPMSAVPFRSRLWSAADSNGTFRITWEDFLLGRSTNTPVCAQIELRRNGDYVTRSNEIETVWRHIDPDDWDGDGYLNEDDGDPCTWDEGAEWYYGPWNDLPPNGNSNAYCTISIEVDGPGSHWVSFTGDGPSDYADPMFLAKPGTPYDVKILIGKTYRVETDTGIRATWRSDENITVFELSDTAFDVVWPVTVRRGPALLTAPRPGLLGSPHDNSFTLAVSPPWLGGIIAWSSRACCSVVGDGDLWRFACDSDCRCGGCLLDGSYTYEGYAVFFDNIPCNCHYHQHESTSFGLTAPPAVFMNGAPRPLAVSFIHGDDNDREEGELELRIVSGDNKVRIWEDAERSCEASTFRWNVSNFGGCTYYLEGVEASATADDIEFELVWTRPGGSSAVSTATTTCAEVLRTEVTTADPDILDGSTNQQPFDGNVSWNFDVTHSPHPDKHFSVLFRDVSNDGFSVRDFAIQMTLVVQPAAASVGTACWFALEPTPVSGTIVSTGARTGELRNPKAGGVYHIASCFDGSPTNECNIVLPLAGAEMVDVLRGDLDEADGFVSRSKSTFPRRWYTRALFASKWFTWDKYGYYRGRPDNAGRPTVYYYNQVDDDNGKGAVGTLLGIPIHVEKLSNLIAGYACEKLEVPMEEQGLSQWYGTGNDESAGLSWVIGTRLAAGNDFMTEVGYLATNAYRYASGKCRKLWPNAAPVDNHRGRFGHGNFNTEFSSPGFIYSNR